MLQVSAQCFNKEAHLPHFTTIRFCIIFVSSWSSLHPCHSGFHSAKHRRERNLEALSQRQAWSEHRVETIILSARPPKMEQETIGNQSPRLINVEHHRQNRYKVQIMAHPHTTSHHIPRCCKQICQILVEHYTAFFSKSQMHHAAANHRLLRNDWQSVQTRTSIAERWTSLDCWVRDLNCLLLGLSKRLSFF